MSIRDLRLVSEFFESLDKLEESRRGENDRLLNKGLERRLTHERLLLSCTARRFVVTAQGRMGLVAEAAREGDEIALMMGGDVPFVVRVKEQGKWVLVGHCYVHGIMKGEPFDEGQCENMVLA